MKYQPAINIWNLTPEQIKQLQPGQWVTAGDDKDPLTKGRYYGVKPGGTIVVAWQGNARGRGKGGYNKYQSMIRQYAKS